MRLINENIISLNQKGNKTNTNVSFFNNNICNFSIENNLPKDWIEFGFLNDLSQINQMGFCITVSKDKENKFDKLAQEFRKEFNRKGNSKNGNFITLYSQQLVVSNKKNGYLTEEEFQNKIREEIEKLFGDKNSVYHKVVSFILNYRF